MALCLSLPEQLKGQKISLGFALTPQALTFTGPDAAQDNRFRLGGESAMTLAYELSPNLVLSSSLGYAMRGTRSAQGSLIQMDYLFTAVGLKYLWAGEYRRFYTGFGASPSGLLRATSDQTNINYAYKKVDVGIFALLGVRYVWGRRKLCDIEFRYQRSLLTIAALSSPPIIGTKTRSFLVFQSGLGLQFSLLWPLDRP